MSHSDTVLCPDCGWTGTASELLGEEASAECPSCGKDIQR